MRKGDEIDPKGLIEDSFRIDGVTAEECRSIFVDWALSIPLNSDSSVLIKVLLERHEQENPNHPMSVVLREGLASPVRKGRRGGRAARVAD